MESKRSIQIWKTQDQKGMAVPPYPLHVFNRSKSKGFKPQDAKILKLIPGRETPPRGENPGLKAWVFTSIAFGIRRGLNQPNAGRF